LEWLESSTTSANRSSAMAWILSSIWTNPSQNSTKDDVKS
jgi:hypothetical protein